MTHSNAFPASRAEGLRRLHAFVPRAGRDYAQGRNSDHGPDARENVSVLSPYLRHRLITEEEVVAAVLARHGAGAAEKFVQEVMWRTYWKGWLEMRPGVWTRYLDTRDADRETAARSGGLRRALAAAEGGETGIAGFDDWAREIAEHGYIHNHARMWFASIWIFTLRLPWALGADFFMRHLIDGDPASNTLSWRWVAGLQTAGKTYLATAENIERYTGGRFRPKGLASVAEALTEPSIPNAAALPVAGHPSDSRALLLLTGEDLCPETLIDGDVAAVMGVRGVPSDAKGAPGTTFKASAAADAAARAGEHYGCAATVVDTLNLDEVLNFNEVLAAAQAAGAEQVVTPYAPVGDTACALDAIAGRLAAAGIPLVRPRRAWDDRFWPHATKGYFAFKQKLPQLLVAAAK